MCLEKKAFIRICKLFPDSHYHMKQKAILHRAFIRKLKNNIEIEIKSDLSESLTKRTLSHKQKTNESKDVRAKSVDQGFHLKLMNIEMDSLEQEESVACEKNNESFHFIPKNPGYKPGGKVFDFGQADDCSEKENKKTFFQNLDNPVQNKFKKPTKIQTQNTLNEDLKNEHKEQKILEKINSLKVLLFTKPPMN